VVRRLTTRRLSVGELRDLLEGQSFQEWWSRVRKLIARERTLERNTGELSLDAEKAKVGAAQSMRFATEALAQAALRETKVAGIEEDLARIDLQAHEAMSAFENQRLRVTDLTKRADAARLVGGELGGGRRLYELLKCDEQRKEHLWEEVCRIAAWSLELRVQEFEARHAAQTLRRQGELHAATATKAVVAAEDLRAAAATCELELKGLREQLDEMRVSAHEQFGCIPTATFLFWPDRLGAQRAWAVALASNETDYNVEVRELGVHQVDMKRDTLFLEPVPVLTGLSRGVAMEGTTTTEGTESAELDLRVEDFFQCSRR